MSSGAVSCVDLFCGAGGLTHGLISEGLRVVAGLDVDPKCRYPYEVNNDAVFLERDISSVDVSEIRDLFPGDGIRIMAGCAPCQPFSAYTRRYGDSRSDPRWGLLYEYARLVRGVSPDIVVMENVPDISRHTVFMDFLNMLDTMGYEVWHGVVNSAAYGTPQMRKRLILLASRFGSIRMIDALYDKGCFRTVRDAIGHLRPIRAGGTDPCDRLHTASRLSEKNMDRIRASRPGGTWRDWPPHLVAECHRNLTGRSYPSSYGRMEWDKPAPTITTKCCQYGSGRFGHPEQDRGISLREAALLQGFPEHYKFVPPDEDVRFGIVSRLIGNAVPVDLGRAIAMSIIQHING